MSSVTLTSDAASLLRQLKETTEVRDVQGQVIGLFTPEAIAARERLDRIKGLFDLEEAQRVLATEKGMERPFKEILQELKTLGKGI